jgi:hypothetical protein
VTKYIVTTFDGDPDDGIARVLDAARAESILAEFFSHPYVSDGMGVMVRRADYADPSRLGYDAAVSYIDAAAGKADRRRRKSEVFHVIYGNDSSRAGVH